MGLDTTHGAWHGPYSLFNTFREKLAEFYGIPLTLMEGFYYTEGLLSPFGMIQLAVEKLAAASDQWEALTKHLPLRWESFKPNPIHELLNHSDCDGELSPDSCLLIADELAQVIKSVEDNSNGVDRQWFLECLIRFEAGCREAAAKNEVLEFG